MRVNPFYYYLGILILLVAILPLPIEFYTFVRISICVISIYIFFQLIVVNSSLWLLFIGCAILYNPIFPIYLHSKSLWVAINLGTVFAIYLALKTKITYETEVSYQSLQSYEKNKRNEPEEKFSSAESQFLINPNAKTFKINNKKSSVKGNKKIRKNEKLFFSDDTSSSGLNHFKKNVELTLNKHYSQRIDERKLQLFNDLSSKYYSEGKNEFDVAMMYMLYEIDIPLEQNGSISSEFVDMQTKKVLSLINKGTAPRSYTVFQLNKFRERHLLEKIF